VFAPIGLIITISSCVHAPSNVVVLPAHFSVALPAPECLGAGIGRDYTQSQPARAPTDRPRFIAGVDLRCKAAAVPRCLDDEESQVNDARHQQVGGRCNFTDDPPACAVADDPHRQFAVRHVVRRPCIEAALRFARSGRMAMRQVPVLGIRFVKRLKLRSGAPVRGDRHPPGIETQRTQRSFSASSSSPSSSRPVYSKPSD